MENGGLRFEQELSDGMYGSPYCFWIILGSCDKICLFNNISIPVVVDNTSMHLSNVSNVELFEVMSLKKLNTDMLIRASDKDNCTLDMMELSDGQYLLNYRDINNELIQTLFQKINNQIFLKTNKGDKK